MAIKKPERYYAIVPAAGVGTRMKADVPKQYLKINHKTILEHTLEKLITHPCIDKVIVAISENDTYFSALPLSKNERIITVSGGAERSDSVFSGLNYIIEELNLSDSWVLVHDAARPCITHRDIDKLIEEASLSPVGGILASPVRDTMKRGSRTVGDDANNNAINNKTTISETVDRNNLWHALTPQMFKAEPLRNALVNTIKAGVMITDEASAMESQGFMPELIVGSSNNIKITQPEDLALAEFYLNRESQKAK